MLEHRPEAIDAWGQTLRTRGNGQPVAVCLERQKGPLVSALRTDDCLGRFPVNPLTLAKYREALTPSRATDDPPEAELPVELLRKPRDKRTPLSPQRPTMRALAPLVEHRRRVVGDHVRLTKRLPSALTHDFPHVLPWFQEKDPGSFCAFLRHWPTLKAAPLARRPTLERFFRAHHGRSPDVITTRSEALKSTVALTTDEGVSTPNPLLVHALGAPLRLTLPAMADFENALAQRAQDHPDCPLVDALPGAGAVFAPRLLGAFGEPRERDAAAEALPKDAGIAPVTERSGKNAWVHWRLQGPTCLRQPCVEWAAESPRHSFWAQVDDQQPRDQGQAHQAAVRALACTWIRSLSRCWQARTPYDASVDRQALKRRSAPLLHHLTHCV